MICDLETLRTRFGLSSFRVGQEPIINSVLAGQDVLAILPTGGGKSLCYQYPAIAKNQLVVVISPLIALMKDQVDSLKRRGLPAGCIHSGQTETEQREVFSELKRSSAFVLYVSPERAQKIGFRGWIKTQSIALFAIDEAHCVSQWGHDFREDYALLKILKEIRPDVPILALTASATPFVLNDIAKQLTLRSPQKHVHGFYRPNLYYQVDFCDDEDVKLAKLKQALRQFDSGRVIIYCGTRKMTKDIATALKGEFRGATFYHAGLSPESRTKIQEQYANGDKRILVATNAFGMGIDHPDVRLVVHYQMPANIDSLYQEMGRAGRDGIDSTCLLLYAKKDKGLQSYFIQSSDAPDNIVSSRWRALDNLVAYAEGSECRHSEILTYYQDSKRIEKCGHCDACEPNSPRRVQEPSADLMLHVYSHAELSRKLNVGLAFPKPTKKKKSRADRKKQRDADVSAMSSADTQIFEHLRAWRKSKAHELDVPAFVVLSDKTLRHLAIAKPKSLGDLNEIYGLGEVKIEKFGQELVAEILLA